MQHPAQFPLSNQILTVAQMRAAEEALIAAGTSVDELMQRAGRGAGEYVRRIAAGRPVTVLCGPGNNGGDGYVIAQHLAEHGNPVRVIAAREPGTEAARTARSLFGGTVLGTEARMNLPNSTEGNWAWRFTALQYELATRLNDLSKLYGRN